MAEEHTNSTMEIFTRLIIVSIYRVILLKVKDAAKVQCSSSMRGVLLRDTGVEIN
jgi:hypothetical protein